MNDGCRQCFAASCRKRLRQHMTGLIRKRENVNFPGLVLLDKQVTAFYLSHTHVGIWKRAKLRALLLWTSNITDVSWQSLHATIEEEFSRGHITWLFENFLYSTAETLVIEDYKHVEIVYIFKYLGTVLLPAEMGLKHWIFCYWWTANSFQTEQFYS